MNSAMEALAVDFRSDTVTQPTDAMKTYMIEQPLGDDVYAEDPTINALQAKVAELTGFEDALFFPTGSMANLAGLMCQCEPGKSLFAGADSHIKLYEMGSYARIAGLNLLEVPDHAGYLDRDALAEKWTPDIYYMPDPGIVAVENTHNMLGGIIYPEDELARLAQFCRERGVPLHMDGARLWHAAQARQLPLTHWTRHLDSVMMCFSKGMGTPVGSILVSSKANIVKARAIRKLLGGGMRQAGVLAAAALFAIEHHFPNLNEDHKHCRMIYDGIRELDWLEAVAPETNILIFNLHEPHAHALAADLEQDGLRFLAISDRKVRIVCHLHTTTAACEQLLDAIRNWNPPR